MYVLLSLNVASIVYCFEDSDDHKMSVQETDYREVTDLVVPFLNEASRNDAHPKQFSWYCRVAIVPLI